MKANVKLNTSEEVALSGIAGKLAAEVLAMIAPYVKVEVTTDELRSFEWCSGEGL